jgi:hypothetical protein
MISNLPSRLSDELAVVTSPLLWLQSQPEYKRTFKERYLMLQKARSPQDKTLKRSKRRRKGRKRNFNEELACVKDPKTPINQKMKRNKRDPNLNTKTKRQVTPLSDAPVSYILKQIDKASEEPLNTLKIDWDVT